jgi:hypothetical protein
MHGGVRHMTYGMKRKRKLFLCPKEDPILGFSAQRGFC